MNKNEFTLNYPAGSGFEKTSIFFFSGKPSPEKIFFYGGSASACPRLFVTDTRIAALDSLKEFKNLFFPYDARKDLFSDGKDFLLLLQPGESAKTLGSVMQIVKTALELNFTRQCSFVAVGGGVISDMTAFAASIFKRGINVDFVPTTLLSMVDASVGGKSGCDYEGFKNMIGSFWPAKNIYIWSDFVLSLPENEFISGLAEAIKTAFLFNKELLDDFSNKKDAVLKRDSLTMEKIIGECVRAKASIVQEDPKEKGRRAFLNLGHTFGHALEAVAGLGEITHGEAVAWGMARAADLSLEEGICSKEQAECIKNILLSYGYDASPFPKVLKSKELDSLKTVQNLIDAMKKDKKNISSEAIRFILQDNDFNTFIKEVDEDSIRKVLLPKDKNS